MKKRKNLKESKERAAAPKANQVGHSAILGGAAGGGRGWTWAACGHDEA